MVPGTCKAAFDSRIPLCLHDRRLNQASRGGAVMRPLLVVGVGPQVSEQASTLTGGTGSTTG